MSRTLWTNDTCQCKIILTNNQGTIELSDWVQKCFLHKDEPTGTLLNTVLIHNHQYDAELETEIPALKLAEYIRIKALGEPVLNV